MVQHVKLLRRSKVHNGFRFKKGLNLLREPFDPSPSCMGGGLYYCKKSDIFHWLYLYGDELGWLADVETPSDARVVKMPYKLKADKIILSNFRKITQETWIQSLSDAQFMKWLKLCDFNILMLQNKEFQKWLATKSEDFHLRAVRANRAYILYLPKASLTERICLTVIKNLAHEFKKFGWNSSTENRWLAPNTAEIINICLSFNGLLIKELPFISAKYLEEVNKNPIALNVGKPCILKDAKFMEVAVKQNPLALHSVKPEVLTDEHILTFLRLDPKYLKYLPKELVTPELLNQTMSLVPDANKSRGFRVIARTTL